MLAKICHGVGHGGGAQQRNPHHVVTDIVSVFAVVQETDSIIAFTQVHPFMSTGLEARPIPTGVAVSRTLYVAPLDFISSLRSQDVYREGDFEHDVTFIPVNMRVEVQSWRVMIE